METAPQPEVFITQEAQNIKPPKKLGKFFIIFAAIIVIILIFVSITVLLNNSRTQTPPQTVQVIQKVNTKLKSGEFLIQEPSPLDTSKQKPEQQVIIKGTFDIVSNTIVIKDVSSQTTGRPLDTIPMSPSTPWIIIETSVSGKVNYSTKFPLVYDEGQTNIPFWINLPYEKQFDLSIYNQDKKLLFSQPIAL